MNAYSPYLALFTGFIELFAFIYFFMLFKQSESSLKSLIAILFFLSGYQLFEAFNCMFPGHSFLVRMSFVDITMLPVLGVYFAYLSSPVESKFQRYITYVFLGSALFFVTFFISKSDSALMKRCQQFFATYYHPDKVYKFYGLYYQLGMFSMLLIAVRNLIFTEDIVKRKLIGDFVMGSIVFIIPSIIITNLIPQFRGSMPSIMCHISLTMSFFIIKALAREQKLREVSLGVEISYLNIRL